MAHHLLDKLDVVRAFTEPRAECVSHVMYAKMRQQFRLTIFQFSLIHFFGVVGDGDTLDGPVDIMGTEKVTFPIPKKETVIPIHHKVFRIEGVHDFNQCAELFSNLRIQDRDGTGAVGCFRGVDVKTCFPMEKNNIAQEYIDGMLNITSVPMLVVIVAAGLVGGLIGAVIGQKALKKHFIKAGLVSVK